MSPDPIGRRHRAAGHALAVVGVLAGFSLAARRLGYRLGPSTIVRCRRNHLFTTIWIPGVKLKGLDLGIARMQHCPVGDHWSLVTPVRDTHLTAEDRELAGRARDLPIP
jgi:hypothetical protein